jgi:14-3-3 protein epsilon
MTHQKKKSSTATPMEPELFMARLAEQAERYDDMFDYLKPVIMKRDHFTPEERSMLSVSFKNLVTPRRTTLRTINFHFDSN